jgi:CBS domain-containing protein
MVPSPSLLAQFRDELRRGPPFDRMDEPALDFFTTHARQVYVAPGEALAEPANGPAQALFYIRQGAVTGSRPADSPGEADAISYEAGDLVAASAALAGRPVTRTYRATQDTFALALPVAALRELVSTSPEFAAYLNRRFADDLARTGRALQEASWSRTVDEQSLETPLGELARRPLVSCAPDTPLREALGRMQAQRIGSILVTDAAGAPLGIFTRHDVLDRVTLPGIALDSPVSAVMSTPVHALSAEATAHDAALTMSRHGIRHVPVVQDGRALGLVSERDLFALQRLSLKGVSARLRAAADVAALAAGAAEIRRFARLLLGQGVSARHATGMISHLNDVLTARMVALEAARHGIDTTRVCWLALGSEGRGEQTIATDQDNALVLAEDAIPQGRAAVLAFAQAVNHGLDACGYPLCKGGVMAGQPAMCRTLPEWRAAFSGWMEHGGPEDLLAATIHFDLRPIAGDEALAGALREHVTREARGNARFLKQMALNALGRRVPLDWRGAIAPDARGGVDLKLQAAAIYTEAARIYALALGVAATGTRERLLATGAALGVPAGESQSWAGGFDFVQSLRLRVQVEAGETEAAAPNHVRLGALSDLERRTLKEALRIAKLLQQRLRLDYDR